ncbi:MAG: ATP synthase F1 subunit epsilon [Buchnera aphidicola (Kaburagia rhusicola ensigallis)]
MCHLNITSPEEFIYFSSIKKIQVLGSAGNLGIYPGHLQLLSFIKSGILYILDQNNKMNYIYLSGGIIEIQPETINILTGIIYKILKLDQKSIIKIEYIIKKKIKNSFIEHKKKLLQTLPYELSKINSSNILKI